MHSYNISINKNRQERPSPPVSVGSVKIKRNWAVLCASVLVTDRKMASVKVSIGLLSWGFRPTLVWASDLVCGPFGIDSERKEKKRKEEDDDWRALIDGWLDYYKSKVLIDRIVRGNGLVIPFYFIFFYIYLKENINNNKIKHIYFILSPFNLRIAFHSFLSLPLQTEFKFASLNISFIFIHFVVHY